MKNRNHQGFTLIELMIVIAIIAILISYALPAYRDYTVRAKLSEGTAMASSYKIAVSEAFLRTGSFTGLNNGMFSIPQAEVQGNCVDAINVTNGEITVDFDCLTGTDGVADPYVDVSQIVWRPDVTSGLSVVWTCIPDVPRPDQDPCR